MKSRVAFLASIVFVKPFFWNKNLSWTPLSFETTPWATRSGAGVAKDQVARSAGAFSTREKTTQAGKTSIKKLWEFFRVLIAGFSQLRQVAALRMEWKSEPWAPMLLWRFQSAASLYLDFLKCVFAKAFREWAADVSVVFASKKHQTNMDSLPTQKIKPLLATLGVATGCNPLHELRWSHVIPLLFSLNASGLVTPPKLWSVWWSSWWHDGLGCPSAKLVGHGTMRVPQFQILFPFVLSKMILIDSQYLWLYSWQEMWFKISLPEKVEVFLIFPSLC